MHWLSLLLTFQQALWIDVPFIQQDKNGCGSASIWMVMMYWQPDAVVNVDEIQRQLYSQEAGGIHAKDMARYFESQGYRTFAFQGDWADLKEHVSKGRPLIVCLERNRSGVPLHYVVVAGVDDIQNLVLVNDPAQRKLLSMSRVEFEQAWRATGNWTLLAVPEVGLASKAFREENLSGAREHLTAALRVNPSDAYVNDFLGTVYFLQNNTEAALKYWNRAGKPAIDNIRIDPPLRTDPILLDRAFTFSRGSILRLSDFEETQARLTALRVFSRYRMELSPTENGRFDITLRGAEKTGISPWSWARGLPFQSINPEFSNIASKGINVGSTLRWDRNKRRAFIFFDTPLKGDPRWGLHLDVDGRDETWTSAPEDFRMRKIQAAAEIRSFASGRWSWTSGASVSGRTFSNGFSGGVELKYSGLIKRTVIRDAADHLAVDSSASIEAGKLFRSAPIHFAKLVTATSLRWRSVTSQVRIGGDIGEVPFDERFTIGLDRDSDLWMRAHPATVDGRKNALNTTRSFILTNSDFQRVLSNSGWFRLSSGPFLDAGKSSISPGWMVDTGIELRLSILSSFEINLSYGKSLTDHNHTLFVREHGL
jgi:tetratricopeptide (TPR) repeat protein